MNRCGFYIAKLVFILPGVEPLAAPRIVYTDQGFPLFWENNANATCGYVVEWLDAFCPQDCPVEWIKLPAGTTNVSIESGMQQLSACENGALILALCCMCFDCWYKLCCLSVSIILDCV